MKFKIVKLKDIVKPKQWKNLSISKLKKEGYPVYGANGIIGFYNEYNHEQPTLAITCRGATCGNIHITLPKSYITSNAMALDELDTEQVDLRYLKYALVARGFNDVITGSAQPQIVRKNLENIKIPLPENLDNQIHIANLLSQVESLIAKREESIKLLDELLKSTFLDMFGDYNNFNLELVDLCDDIVDCPHSTPKYSDVKTDFSCLRTSEFSNGYIDNSSMKYVNENEYLKRVKRLVPKFGDVVYAREGSYGDAIRIPQNQLICLGQRTLLFRPKDEICNSIFLWALIRSEDVFRQAKKKNKGATVGRVNVKDIKEFKVFLPPILLQDKFATIVQQVEQTKQQHQKSLKELKNLFGSLSHRAFRGELDLRGMEGK